MSIICQTWVQGESQKPWRQQGDGKSSLLTPDVWEVKLPQQSTAGISSVGPMFFLCETGTTAGQGPWVALSHWYGDSPAEGAPCWEVLLVKSIGLGKAVKQQAGLSSSSLPSHVTSALLLFLWETFPTCKMGISVAIHGSLGLQRTMAYATWVFSMEPTINVQ